MHLQRGYTPRERRLFCYQSLSPTPALGSGCYRYVTLTAFLSAPHLRLAPDASPTPRRKQPRPFAAAATTQPRSASPIQGPQLLQKYQHRRSQLRQNRADPPPLSPLLLSPPPSLPPILPTHDRARLVFDEMRAGGITPPPEATAALIRALAKGGRGSTEALRPLGDMQASAGAGGRVQRRSTGTEGGGGGGWEDRDTVARSAGFGGAIEACAVHGEWQKAVSLLDEMREVCVCMCYVLCSW